MLSWNMVDCRQGRCGHRVEVPLNFGLPSGSLLLYFGDQAPSKFSKGLHLNRVISGSSTARLSRCIPGRYTLHNDAVPKHSKCITPAAFMTRVPTRDLRVPFDTLRARRQSWSISRRKEGRVYMRNQSLGWRLKRERKRRQQV